MTQVPLSFGWSEKPDALGSNGQVSTQPGAH
jgi:hypothetical protein